MSANVLVVPALPSGIPNFDLNTDQPASPALLEVQQTLARADIGVMTLPDLPQGAEYDLDVSGQARTMIAQYALRQERRLQGVDALVIVNDASEVVMAPDRRAVCEVSYSIGRVATHIMAVADQVFGPRSGRVFLSHRYPDGTELFSARETHRSVTIARSRLLGIYPSRPIALQNNYRPLIETARRYAAERTQ